MPAVQGCPVPPAWVCGVCRPSCCGVIRVSIWHSSPVTLLLLPTALPSPQAGPSHPSRLCPLASSSRQPALIAASPCLLHGTHSGCSRCVSRARSGKNLALNARGPALPCVCMLPLRASVICESPSSKVELGECCVAGMQPHLLAGSPVEPDVTDWELHTGNGLLCLQCCLCLLEALMFLGNEIHYPVFSRRLRKQNYRNE